MISIHTDSLEFWENPRFIMSSKNYNKLSHLEGISSVGLEGFVYIK